MTRYLRISGLCFSLAVIVSLLGFVAAFAELTTADTLKPAPQEIIAPTDVEEAVGPSDVEEVIGPIDIEAEKAIAPLDGP